MSSTCASVSLSPVSSSVYNCLSEHADLASTAALSDSIDLVADFLQCLLGLEYHGICIVSCINGLFPLLILCLELSSFFHCLVDIGIRHVGAGGDGDMLLFSGTQILSGYIYDTVGINIKGNLDLRNASSCRRDSIQTELAEGLVVFRELSLTLYYVDVYSGLVIRSGGEDLALLGRDRGISLDQSGCDTAHGLDGQGQRSNIQKKDIACTCIACQLTALNGSTDCYTLIRVQRFARLMSGQLFYLILYCRDTCGTTYQQNLTKFGSGDTCIAESVLYRDQQSALPDRESAHQILLWSGSYQNASDLLRLHVMNGRLMLVVVAADSSFFAFSAASFSLCSAILSLDKIYTLCLLEFSDHIICDLLVEVITAQMVVAVR